MLSIFATTEWLETIKEMIGSEDRLSELVALHDSMEKRPQAGGNGLLVDSKGIRQPVDWQNISPPYLLPSPLKLEKEVLLGLIFNKLGNNEKAWSYLRDRPRLLFDLGMVNRLQHGFQIDPAEFPSMPGPVTEDGPYENYRILHNAAVVGHYGFLAEIPRIETLKEFYEQALGEAPDPEHKAYTAKHYASLLLDAGELHQAEHILKSNLQDTISEDARFGLQSVLISVWMRQLAVPYDARLLENLKSTLWATLRYFEDQGRQAEAGLLLTDAAHIANISESFTESLGYISKAIRIFEEEGLEELWGNAQLRKGTLLYTWAQNGNPQFYKPAIEAYQQALKIFRQEHTPDVFAEIHHNLAVLYSEMPAENKKRGIWAGIASASFQEALNYFSRESHPYEYGMICNNFGNALMKFPAAVHSDNYEKALYYYQEALNVRTADYPYERAITLLNFLEASWNVSNGSDEFNETRYADMLTKAGEIEKLVDEPDMIAEAQKHLDFLHKLKATVSK